MHPEPKERHFADINVGDTASFDVEITPQLVADFAKVSGDYSPLHTDEAYGKTTPFGTHIPHGMIAGALFSRLMGMELPGKYSMCMSQSMMFHHPLPLSGVVYVRGEVAQKVDSMHAIRLATTVTDTSNAVLVRGEAFVKVLK